jgi:3,4-dihydroxy 2-butanone 4-phosphate synthase/GTP cyclohydrolase II
VYEIVGESRQFFALCKCDVATTEPVLCRVHSGSVVGDLFSSTPVDGGHNLREAVLAIEKAGAGVILYIPPKGDLMKELVALDGTRSGDDEQPWTLREFGLGAQVLADLGVHQIRLLTNSQLKIAGLTGFGLKVVERVPLVSMKVEG